MQRKKFVLPAPVRKMVLINVTGTRISSEMNKFKIGLVEEMLFKGHILYFSLLKYVLNHANLDRNVGYDPQKLKNMSVIAD
jgi:hypothetical protein